MSRAIQIKVQLANYDTRVEVLSSCGRGVSFPRHPSNPAFNRMMVQKAKAHLEKTR